MFQYSFQIICSLYVYFFDLVRLLVNTGSLPVYKIYRAFERKKKTFRFRKRKILLPVSRVPSSL